MECTTCLPTPGRSDRPHTFFAHQMTTCAGCGGGLEGRVVLRDGSAVILKHCLGCGPSEETLSDDATAWVGAFLARGERPDAPTADHPFEERTATRPTCRARTPGQ